MHLSSRDKSCKTSSLENDIKAPKPQKPKLKNRIDLVRVPLTPYLTGFCASSHLKKSTIQKYCYRNTIAEDIVEESKRNDVHACGTRIAIDFVLVF